MTASENAKQPETVAVPEDRVITRLLAFDLTLTAPAYRWKIRPENKKRQKIVRFHEKRDDIEYFELRQTTPYCGYEAFCPPSQRQYDAVMAYYSEPSETRYQISMMLAARDYAKAVSDKHTFSAGRRQFIAFCTASFILSDKKLRAMVHTWNIGHSDEWPASSTGTYQRCYKRIAKFSNDLVADMRNEGAEIFG